MLKIRPMTLDVEPQFGNTPFVIPKNRAIPPVIPVSYDRYRISPNKYQCPVALEIPSSGKRFVFPTDPLISVTTKNILVRRQVLKSDFRGTVKERWSQDDFNVNIAGVFISDESHVIEDYVDGLLEMANAAESLKIISDFLNDVYKITRIAIENVDFPFTQGIDCQKFTVKAYSDDEYSLLLD